MAKDRPRKTRAVLWFHRLLRWFLGSYMIWRYRITSEHQEVVDNLKPPYIVVPNHVMTFDPLLVNYYIPVPVHYVASDANFRSPFTSFWLRQVGTIATSKLTDDMASLRLMLKTLKEGKVIGIFAEGQRSWDGVSLPIIPSTAKLVRIAKVPVLVSLLKGGYMCIPRWSFHGRRGRVVVEQKLAVSAKEAATLSVDEITKRIEAALEHDDSEYQNVKRVPYASKRTAENLQLALFYCPGCRSFNTMYSKKRRFFCRSCGYEVEFTQYYRFKPVATRDAPVFGTIREWSLAQNDAVYLRLSEAERAGNPVELFSDDAAVMLTGYRLARLREQGQGRLSLHLDGLRFRMDAGRHRAAARRTQSSSRAVLAPGEEKFFPWSNVKALNIVYQDQLEFYAGRTLFVFRFPKHDTSAYKYELCSRMLDDIRSGSPEP